MNSKQKGSRGERLLRDALRDHGYEVRRSVQYAGGVEESADLVGLPHVHVECKFVEKLNLREAMEQAIRDSLSSHRLPTVFHKTSRSPWLVTMRLDDWIVLFREYEMGKRE